MIPISSKCFLNGNIVDEETTLTQGDIVQFGDCLKFRFNNPKEASLLLEKRRSGNFSAEVNLNDYMSFFKSNGTELITGNIRK